MPKYLFAKTSRRTKLHKKLFGRSRLKSIFSRIINTSQPASFERRLGIISTIIVLLFCLMGFRLWYLQIVNSNSYSKQVNANSIRVVSISPPRGYIYDRSGKLLVGNAVVNEVELSRVAYAKHPDVLNSLSIILGVSVTFLKSQIGNPNYSPYKPVPLVSNVGAQQIAEIEENKGQLPGVTVSQISEPNYIYGETAAQLLGYVGDITSSELKSTEFKGYTPDAVVGQSGVEASYEKYLRGVPGYEKLVVNSQGNVVAVADKVSAQPGDSVVLSLDLGLQQTVEASLASQIQSLRHTIDPVNHTYPPATGGAAVVLDVNTGQVLAMASYPSYDPQVWDGGISEANYLSLVTPTNNEPILNRAIQGLYTPGSTFKLATATAALDDGLITSNTVIDDPGTFTIPHCVGKCTFHDDDSVPLGPISLVKAIAASSDVFFYNLGYDFYINPSKYGSTPIQNIANQYGFGQTSGIDLPGELSGRVDSPQMRQYLHQHFPSSYPNEGWYAGDNLELAFGQGETVITPLQLALAYATFSNGGTRYVPHVAAEIVSPDGKVVKQIAPEIANKVPLPPSTYQPMLQGFEDVITKPYGTIGGSLTFASFPYSQFPVGGKTGTASTNHVEPNGLFAAFGPTNKPQYAVAVVIDQAGYGATTAAPVAEQALLYLFHNPPGPVIAPNPSS